MQDRGEQRRRATIVTVHGTNDSAASETGEKWFQQGSAFAASITERLAARGIDAELKPHLWSGANSAEARMKGAELLVAKIKVLAKTFDEIHIVGHSHGGNVANDAALLLNWSGRACPSNVKSVTTVGTPFFRRRAGLMDVAVSHLFLAAIALMVVAFVALLSAVVYLTFQEAVRVPQYHSNEYYQQEAQRSFDSEGLGGVSSDLVRAHAQSLREAAEREPDIVPGVFIGLAVCAFIAVLMSVLGMARKRALRIRTLSRRTHQDARLFAIFHRNDEAIAFLQRVDKMPIVAFPRGALLQGSHNLAFGWGVFTLLFFLGCALTVVAVGLSGATSFLGLEDVSGGPVDLGPDREILELGVGALLYVAYLSPLLFFGPYFAGRLIAGAIPEFLLRGQYNRVVANALKGMAFGKDGNETLGAVSSVSHTFACTPCPVEGEAFGRMQANSQGAASALIEKYRWSLFAVGGEDETAIGALATDAMTWKSLIHTTYFDQPEVADMIADHIAAARH